MNETELQTLLNAAKLAKIDPSGLKPVNPFTQSGERAQAMQMAVSEVDPAQAARWRIAAGETISLASAAAKAGLAGMTPAAHEELKSLDADYIAGAQEAEARREADLLDSLEKGAAGLAEKREAQQQAFARSAGKNSTGSHVRDFHRRLGITNPAQLGNIPARRLTDR